MSVKKQKRSLSQAHGTCSIPPWSVKRNTYGTIYFVENRDFLTAGSFNGDFVTGAKQRAEALCKELNEQRER